MSRYFNIVYATSIVDSDSELAHDVPIMEAWQEFTMERVSFYKDWVSVTTGAIGEEQTSTYVNDYRGFEDENGNLSYSCGWWLTDAKPDSNLKRIDVIVSKTSEGDLHFTFL